MNPIDEYIQRQDEAVQPQLNVIRDTIRAAIPDAEEKISYQMPTYWKGRNIIHFAAYKNHIGLYPGGEEPDVFDRFRGRGYSPILIEDACGATAGAGFDTLYLATEHIR